MRGRRLRRDGNLDIFVPNYGKNVLWHNNGDGTFTNTAAAMGVAVENHAVGAAWGDYDNDGWPDLMITSYHGEPGQQVPADALFHNDGGKSFTDVIADNPLLNAGDHGVTWVDYDQDGALDLSITRGYSPVGGHFLFRNAMPAQQASQSLSIVALDAKGKYNQPGAEVRVYDKAGKLLGTGLMPTGGGYGAQGAVPVHVGLPGCARESRGALHGQSGRHHPNHSRHRGGQLLRKGSGGAASPPIIGRPRTTNYRIR